MPFYYDVNAGGHTSNGSAGTILGHLRAVTIANQETVAVKGIFLASRFSTAGGAQLRVNVPGTTGTAGTAITPQPRNLRGNPAAQSTWSKETIVLGTGTILTRLTVGFAQTGGMGGWVPVEAGDAIQMMPNTTNPNSLEFSSIAATASVTFDMTVEFSEGI